MEGRNPGAAHKIVKNCKNINTALIFHNNNGGLEMLIAGIAGCLGRVQISELINSIMDGKGYKVSITDSITISRLDEKKLNDYLNQLSKNDVDILVIKIEEPRSGTRLLNYIDYNVIIFTGITDDISMEEDREYREFLRTAFRMMDKKGIMIINVDGARMENIFSDSTDNVIGYGFKSNSVITTSSIGNTAFEGVLICCIQKALKDLNGKTIEPQERKILLPASETKIHNILAAVAFDIISGMDTGKLRI